MVDIKADVDTEACTDVEASVQIEAGDDLTAGVDTVASADVESGVETEAVFDTDASVDMKTDIYIDASVDIKAGVDIDCVFQDDIPALAVRAGTSSGAHSSHTKLNRRSHTFIEYRIRRLDGSVSRTHVFT